MLIGEPQPSEYDWRFSVLGFNTRVTWLFWAVSAALGYSGARNVQQAFETAGIPCNLGILLAIWVGVTFVSIMVHELGHALVYRFYGIECEIVLYQMGGLAIPGAGMLWNRRGQRTRLSHRDSILISAAGPGFQLLLACIVGLTATLCGHYVYGFDWIAKALEIKTSWSRNPFMFSTIYFTVYVSTWWALINLLPIYPLDGGHIAQHIIGMVRRNSGLQEAYALGVVVAILCACWFYRTSTLNALLFASMAVSNLQALQATNGPRFW
jgi:stage IV sporulation protein FB